MNQTVPALSVVFMIITMLVGIAIPAGLLLIIRKKYKASPFAFFTGCGVMLVFALILEQLAHALILNSTFDSFIRLDVWAYGIYGGFMAGLFEETGRYIAFRTVLKKKRNNDANALMYGAGHGGFEAFYLLFVGMLNNVIYAVMMNTGNISLLTSKLSGSSLTSLLLSLEQLASYPPAMFLLGIPERIAAVCAQIALSVIVWFAAKNGGKATLLYPLAIVLHLLLDAGAVILNSYVPSVLFTEIFVFAFAAACVLLAVCVWRKNKNMRDILSY